MVTPVAIFELLLIVGIAVLLICLALNLGSSDKKKKPFTLLALIIITVVIIIVLFVISGIQPIIDLFSAPIGIKLLLIIIVSILLIAICIILNTIESRNKTVDYIVFGLIILFAILVVVILMIDGLWFIWAGWFNDGSLHLGLILGLPALICITSAMILVLYNEAKFVFWHGLLGITAWILTLINVISLFWMSQQNILNYSGLTHFMHIIGGGGGLAAGFANALFGVSGQRKPAKLTGFITLGCWWGAFFLGLLL